MKKKYNTPSVQVMNMELQEVVAMSSFDSTTGVGSQSISNAEQGTGTEELSAGYRNNLWDN